MAKKILSEAQVRRFAKLANLSPINEMTSMYEEEEEVGMEDPMADVEGDVEMEADPEMDAEMDAEMEEPVADEGGDLAAREQMVQDVVMAVADALDVEVAIEGGEAEAEVADLEEPVGEPEGEVAGELEDAAADELGAEEELGDEILEALRGINYVPGKKEIVNEVAKRVAKRLLKAKQAEAELKEALGTPRRVRRSTRRRRK